MFKLKLNHSGKFILFLLILVLIGLWFYWFQYRPTQGRKDCWQKLKQEMVGKSEVNRESMNNYFSSCLVGKGLKSESLF